MREGGGCQDAGASLGPAEAPDRPVNAGWHVFGPLLHRSPSDAAQRWQQGAARRPHCAAATVCQLLASACPRSCPPCCLHDSARPCLLPARSIHCPRRPHNKRAQPVATQTAAKPVAAAAHAARACAAPITLSTAHHKQTRCPVSTHQRSPRQTPTAANTSHTHTYLWVPACGACRPQQPPARTQQKQPAWLALLAAASRRRPAGEQAAPG